MLIPERQNETKWFQNLFYAQEWQVQMNTYKVDESGRLPNGTLTIGNYSSRAIFSSTIKYIQLPTDVYQKVIRFLLYDKSINGSSQVRLEKDPSDGQFYYYATCRA